MKTNDLRVHKIVLFFSAIIAPVSLPILFFLINYFFSGSGSDRNGYVMELVGETTIAILPLSYLFSLPLGLILGIALYRLNKFSARHIISLSTFFGLVIGVVFPLMVFDSHSNNASISSGLIYGIAFGMAGLVVSTTFCVLNKLLGRFIHPLPD